MGKEFIRNITVLGEVPLLGPVILFDDMEDLFKWTKTDGTGDSVLEKSTTTAYNKGASMHVKTRTTAAAENDNCYGMRTLYQRPGHRYAFECLFMPDAAASAKVIEFKIQIEDGVESHKPWIRYDQTNHKWQYYKPTATWQDIPAGGQNLAENSFHRMRLEWDENSKELISFVCDGSSFAVAGLEYDNPTSSQPVNLRIDLGLVAGASPPGEIYVDDVLIMEI